ncbi:ATP-binding protein [Nocardia arthritidis]|uniref:ATP-binding protein n=1 Tax=Nocardia arthritidis TaxID=228602 RepID=UPI0007A43BD0|nr:ATP-binding protein [Nocardia arthritidis]
MASSALTAFQARRSPPISRRQSVAIEITVADDLTVVIEDDGCAVPTDVAPSGLTNPARRAEQAAGTITVAARRGPGWQHSGHPVVLESAAALNIGVR